MLGIALLLLSVGLLLLVAEAFIPGGIVGTIATLIILVSGILFVREYGWTAGLVYYAVSAVVGFVVWLVAFLLVARRLALSPPEPVQAASIAAARRHVGAKALVVQALRPTGSVEIDGKRLAARSEATNVEIPPGTEVVVTGIDSSYLVVEPVSPSGGGVS